MSKSLLALTISELHNQNNGWWSTLPPPPGQYAIGVPNPEIDFGYCPRTRPVPADPQEWAANTNAANWYYVNNETGNDANGNGRPGAPRRNIPTGTHPAGTVIVVEKTNTLYTTSAPRYELTLQGTPENPCWFVGRGGFPEFDERLRLIGCRHAIFDGIRSVKRDGGAWEVHYSQQSQYLTLRNSEFQGDQTNVGFGSVLGLSGPSGSKSHHIVIWNNHIWGYGDVTDSASTPENDIHGCKPAVNITDLWFIGNHVHHMGGDSIQVADANTAESNICQRIYIAKNDMHDNFENAVDIKHSDDIIISQNKMYNFRMANIGAAATMTPLVVHNNAERVWALFNEVYDVASGPICTGGDNVHFIGNLIRDVRPADGVSWSASSSYSGAEAMHMRGTSNATIAWNTVVNYQRGTILIGSQTVNHTGNLYFNRTSTAGDEIRMSTSGGHSALTTDNNLYHPVIEAESFNRNGDIQDLAGWRATTGKENNSTLGDPQLTNFIPAVGSAADNAGAKPPAIAQFENLYGLSIDIDYLKNNRPSNPTIGAYEAA